LPIPETVFGRTKINKRGSERAIVTGEVNFDNFFILGFFLLAFADQNRVAGDGQGRFYFNTNFNG
jgi:hypothetical protein